VLEAALASAIYLRTETNSGAGCARNSARISSGFELSAGLSPREDFSLGGFGWLWVTGSGVFGMKTLSHWRDRCVGRQQSGHFAASSNAERTTIYNAQASATNHAADYNYISCGLCDFYDENIAPSWRVG